MTQLHVYLRKNQLLPMYLTQATATEWSLKHLNESQINWLGRRNWEISFLKPQVYNLLSDSPINYQFCLVADVQSSSDLSFAQLLFSDCYLEVSE